MLDLGWLQAEPPPRHGLQVGVGQDPRVTALQQTINTILSKVGAAPGAPASVPQSGTVDAATCAAITDIINRMGSIQWVTQVSPTMTVPLVQDPSVFAAAVKACVAWPPKPTQPPKGFPHTYDVKSGDTLITIGQQFGKTFWQTLQEANPFISTLGGSSPIPVNVLWLPMNWKKPGLTVPSSISLPVDKKLSKVAPPPQTGIPFLPFSLPAFPAGIDPAVSLQAIAALQSAATACPSLAQPNSDLHHAAMAFATFAAVSVALDGNGQEALATLQEQLNAMCPAWRTTVPGVPMPGAPPPSHPISGLLNQLVLLLGAAATTGDLTQLPALAQQAEQASLPETAVQINRLVENPPVAQEAAQESGAEGDTAAAGKKGIGGAAIAAVVVIGGAILYFVMK